MDTILAIIGGVCAFVLADIISNELRRRRIGREAELLFKHSKEIGNGEKS